MTVRRMNAVYPGGFRPQAGVAYPSRQVQNWARGLENSVGSQRKVITESRTALPVFSARGIRRDVLTVFLSLLLLLFVCVLLADVEAVHSGRERVGLLTDGIASLESTNIRLREELSVALDHPVLRRSAENEEPLRETTVILSLDPET